MSNTLYFKDVCQKDDNNKANVIYRVEDHKMFIEVIDKQHPIGYAKYFSSIKKRDEFVTKQKDRLIRITEKEVNNTIEYWKNDIQ